MAETFWLQVTSIDYKTCPCRLNASTVNIFVYRCHAVKCHVVIDVTRSTWELIRHTVQCHGENLAAPLPHAHKGAQRYVAILITAMAVAMGMSAHCAELAPLVVAAMHTSL